MSQFRRDYFALKRAEAMDIDDPRSFAVHRTTTSPPNRTEYRARKPFCTLHSNRNCSECKKKKVAAQKRRRQRTLGMDILVNDFHGFNWIDPKVNSYQNLNISGKGIESTRCNGGIFQNNRLFFPELALNRQLLIAEQIGIYRKLPRERNEGLKKFENKQRLPELCAFPRQREDNKERLLEPMRAKRRLQEEKEAILSMHVLGSERKDFENNGWFHVLPKKKQEVPDCLDVEKRFSPVLDTLPRERQKDLEMKSFEQLSCKRTNDGFDAGSSGEFRALENTNTIRRRINIVLPRISQEMS